jgi:transposase
MTPIEADKCYVYGGVVDLRKGPDGLGVLVGGAQPGILYVFSNRTRELFKCLAVNTTGVWCGTRRLHHSRFAWPEHPSGQERLSAQELACLMAGNDVKKLRQTLFFSRQ